MNRSELMRRVGGRGTEPELLLRSALRARGLRFHTCVATLPGKPDIVFASKRLAVFVDGEFWHGIQWRKRGLDQLDDQFSNNPAKGYWLQKIRRNQRRDRIVTSALLGGGWKVLRFWEHDVRADPARCAESVRAALANESTERDETNSLSYSLIPSTTVLEFFAGIGLVRKALEQDGWKVIFSNDVDPQKFEMYRARFPDACDHFVLGDIRRLAPECVPAATLATASFPCNDLSLAGGRTGLKGRHSSTFWNFLAILKSLGNRKPPIVLLENVTGFLTSGNGKDFAAAMAALNKLGYGVDPLIIDAARFVPQSRKRLFVVAVLGDSGREVFAEVGDTRPAALACFIRTHKEIRWNLRSLPQLPMRSLQLQDILDDLPDDSPEWWNTKRAAYLLSQMSRKHHEVAAQMIGGNEFSYGAIFRRVRNGTTMAELRCDGVAGCLRTPRGGSGRQILFKAGFGGFRVRLFTPNECARLMGIDDYGRDAHPQISLNKALFGFGDAVCVPVVEWIARNYLEPLVTELLRGKRLWLGKEGI